MSSKRRNVDDSLRATKKNTGSSFSTLHLSSYLQRSPDRRICLWLLFGLMFSSPEWALAQDKGSVRTTPRSAVVEANQQARPQDNGPGNVNSPFPGGMDVKRMLSPGGLTSTLQIMLLLTVLSLAPSILIMTTSFIRFVIVLGLLRQALGTQQLPPNQVIVSLCLFLTFLVMAPVWQESYEQGIRPYTDPRPGQAAPDFQTAFQNTILPLRTFMIDQIVETGNSEAVALFLEFQQPDSESDQDYQPPEFLEDAPLSVLLPAFMLSEVKTAFLIGFQLYLPFVVIDMVISSVLISMGMIMLPPVLISLPFKLLLFVLIDGWFLTVGMMLNSVQPYG